MMEKKVKYLVVDTNAFINNAPIKDIGENIYTIQEVIDEVTSKRQLRHLSVLSYDLILKDVFPENIKLVTDFSKKTGDYPSLSAVDLKVIALTYQLEKEHVGVSHLNDTPTAQKSITTRAPEIFGPQTSNGFFQSVEKSQPISVGLGDELQAQINELKISDAECDGVLVPVTEETTRDSEQETDEDESSGSEDDETGWITTSNISQVKKDLSAHQFEDASAEVACVTADFAMQNVLKQIGLKVAAYDGRLIRRVQTFILRCITCFKTTSIMSKQFCPSCGHASLKKVGVTIDQDGKQQIHINNRRPLTARGMRFSLPAPKGGPHAQNPRLNEDQPRSNQRATRLARTKNNPLNPDYIAGFSPFIMRDVNSKSAVLGIRSCDIKNYMRKNPNESRRKKK